VATGSWLHTSTVEGRRESLREIEAGTGGEPVTAADCLVAISVRLQAGSKLVVREEESVRWRAGFENQGRLKRATISMRMRAKLD